MKRVISLFLAFLFLAGTVACGEAEPYAAVPAVTGEPVRATEEPVPEMTATPVPTPEATPAPTEDPAAQALELWQAFDHDFVFYLFKEDVSSYNQLIKDPATLPIRDEDVVITLGSYDKSEYERYYADMHVFLDRLDAIDRDLLPEAERYAYDAVRAAVELDIDGEEFYGYFEPLEAYSGIQADLPIVFWLYDIRDEQDAELYLALLETVPEFMESLLNYEKYRAELGIFMPEENLEKVLEDIGAVLSTGEDSFLIPSFEAAVDALELPEEKRAGMKTRNRELIDSAFLGGYQTLYDGLDRLRPFCRPSVGIRELGNETYSRYYEYFLKVSCCDEVTVQAAADLLSEYIVKDYKLAINAYIGGADYFDGTLSLGTAEENMQYLYELNKDTLPGVPEPEITYVSVPEKMKDVFAPAAYLIAAFDDPSHVVIILNSPEEDEELLKTLAHEGWYGHLYQYAGVRGIGTSMSQQFLQGSAYSEAFSQMGEYFFITNTQKFDSDSLMLSLGDDWMLNDLIAYSTILVNGLGYTKSKLKSHLKEVYEFDAQTAETIYEISVQLPFYYLPYIYGLARFRSIYEKLGYSDWKSFYEDCFAVGPTYFNTLEAACRERNGLPAAEEELPAPETIPEGPAAPDSNIFDEPVAA